MPRTRAQGGKPQLSFEAIVDAAIRVLEAEGIGALNMRRIALEVDTSPMSLYRYIATKEDLLTAIADRYLAEVDLPDTRGLTWRETITASIVAVHHAFLDHPHLGSVIALQHVDAVAIFQATELILDALRQAGLDPDETVQALDVLNSYAMGFTQRKVEFRRSTGAPARRLLKIEALPSDQYENVVALAGQIATLDLQDSFESGLQWLLDGIEARANRPRSGGKRA
jgi:TetR/AcrR family tetracycline transcriptional repressor